MSDHAVFFDPSRKRWSWIKRLGTAVGLASAVIMSLFLISVATTPFLPTVKVGRALRRSIRQALRVPLHSTKLLGHNLANARKKLLDEIAGENRLRERGKALPPMKAQNIVAAFYAPWQETGVNSLRENVTKLTHVMPIWVQLNANATSLDFRDWDMRNGLNPSNQTVIDLARENKLNIVPVWSNATGGEFDAQRVHLFLNDVNRQLRLIGQVRGWVQQNGFQGINIDFENLQAADYPLLVSFLRRVRDEFAPLHLIVSADLEAKKYTPAQFRAAASFCDYVVVMIYDEHSSAASGPGPISSIQFFRDILSKVTTFIPREKLVIGLANYAYDWQEESDWVEPLTYQQALVRARDYRGNERPQTLIDFDPDALNPNYWYVDGEDKQHEVWMLDAVTAANEWSLAQRYAPRGVAVWALGMTDPTIWSFLDRATINKRPNYQSLQTIAFPFDVEYTGEGEITRVAALPAKGARTLEIDPQTHLALDESYSSFPSSYVIERSGYHPKMIALTIDDGPSDPFTGQMLDELKQLNVKATFFLIGENAERYPNLVRRIWAEGHEIGNHSYTHPNIGTVPPQRARFELNATQRVFQSLLKRSTILFRPPYNADAAPNSKEEVGPIEIATSLNYITVLELIDPQDWNPITVQPDGVRRHRTAQDMLDSVRAQIENEHGSCILLHDGGGNRAETVKLLPTLIQTMRAQGYQFVTVSDLMNSTRAEVNPPVTQTDTFMLASDRVVFEAMYLFELFLSIAFISGIILGTLRVIFVTVLAIVEKWRTRHAKFAESYEPAVSVVIAAYNEEKVIARTIEAVLANGYPNLEVIVVDDGSKDDTAGAVTRQFRGRVRLFLQENAGKAAALNSGIAHASGEIIIALDADTIFAKDTIRKLVRHFANPIVGAVAGNVKVGNRINPLTYWQAIEYITSQNLDRRAYAVINSVTVVPGAVGAWRREAVMQASGYTTDTMAEDMDLTWRIRRIGWRIETDSDALGYTEAPDTFRALFKQRFRWAFGTLQCLWKHRRAVGRYGWFGTVMLPSLWLFQIAYQAISPLVDLQILWSVIDVLQAWGRTHSLREWHTLPQALEQLWLVAFMYAFFFIIELLGSLVAFKLDRENKSILVWLFWQRFLYRQLMYAVLLKSVKTALSGMRTGWGKLERKGTVEMLPEPEAETA